VTRRRRLSFAVLAGVALATAFVLAATVGARTQNAADVSAVATANTRAAGYAPASKLSRELRQIVVAQGSMRLENPSAQVGYYGYDSDVLTATGEAQMIPTPASPTEAHKTEPDKNTYLVFKNGLPGADPAVYGTRFLYQGHEAGAPGYITRINLDADADHRVTLVAQADKNGTPLPDFDGSTWDPWAQRLLFTAELSGTTGGVWAADLGVPAAVEDVSGALGRGGYEGIQNDSAGNVWVVEDSGGTTTNNARRPNSFVFRYVPRTKGDLHNGKLQALQVLKADGTPITFASTAGPMNPEVGALHTYGTTFDTRWVTLHDTATDGTVPFDANALAKARNATPFKRPENGVFRPDEGFTQFFFTETGDTNAASVDNPAHGGWGNLFRLLQRGGPGADAGKLTLFYKGDLVHNAFDNLTFAGKNKLLVVEDAGEGLHQSKNALDSGWVFDLAVDYSSPPVRWLAEGRDVSATLDAANGGFGKNDQDNELTGVHVSDGDPSVDGILGAKVPRPFEDRQWHWFYTQQHGDNVTYEVVSANG
jgi:hypothetical protein